MKESLHLIDGIPVYRGTLWKALSVSQKRERVIAGLRLGVSVEIIAKLLEAVGDHGYPDQFVVFSFMKRQGINATAYRPPWAITKRSRTKVRYGSLNAEPVFFDPPSQSPRDVVSKAFKRRFAVEAVRIKSVR